jgi:hypothetical protein
VCFRAGIDRTADFGDPQLHLVMGQQWQGQAELVPVEGPVWLTDDDCLEAAVRIGKIT